MHNSLLSSMLSLSDRWPYQLVGDVGENKNNTTAEQMELECLNCSGFEAISIFLKP